MHIIHLVSHPCGVVLSLYLLFFRIRSLLKLQRSRQMEIAPQILLILKNCELCRRSCGVRSIQAQTVGAMSAQRTQTSTSGWDWRR